MSQPPTDWSAYGECLTCLVDAGKVCRHEQARRGERGLGHQGRRPLARPHAGRRKIPTQ